MERIGLAESVIENEVGCGLFQVLIVFLLFFLVKLTSVFTFIFMSFGNYNPGWRCLDNNTDTDTLVPGFGTTNYTVTAPIEANVPYSKELSCDVFEACRLVEFNPESSTIVTEWGLVCDRAWISSSLISIQMAGNLLGSLFSGQAADTLGRKKTLYGSILINILFTSVSIFSTSWEMFAVFRFLIGASSAFFESLNYVYPSEFMTRKWRGPLSGIPGWAIGGILFGVTCMVLRDWKHVLMASNVVFFISLIPVLWVPESLRWLEVKNKNEQFKKATEKMIKLNKKDKHQSGEKDVLGVMTVEDPMATALKKVDTKTYTTRDLFHSDYRCVTFIISFSWMTLSIIFYAISFGFKALSGNFYLNIILAYSIFVPCMVFPFFATNVLGRRRSSYTFIFASACASFAAMTFQLSTSDNTRTIAVLIFVIVAMVCVDTAWTSQQVHLGELYPTVVRGLAMNWASAMSRVGGIISPFLIPRDSDNVFVWYLVMGCLGLVAGGMFTRLPETKGKPLKETFEKIAELEIIVEDKNDDPKKEGGILPSSISMKETASDKNIILTEMLFDQNS